MRSALLLLLTLMAANVAALAKVEGEVRLDPSPLPGCTVTLKSGTLTRTTFTDAGGRYRFEGVAEDEYEIHFELTGFDSAEQRVLVHGDSLAVPRQELRVSATTETLTVACAFAACGDVAPTGRFDLPRCSDYELHTALIESASRGDVSSTRLLQTRYATADTTSERHRLAGALLREIPNDTAIWNDLVREAEIAVRFPRNGEELSPEFMQWSAEQNVDPENYWWMALDALEVAGHDPRSRALLLRALATDDEALRTVAIGGLAKQHDLASLPLIERTIVRASGDRELLVLSLGSFLDERADAVALKYLEDEAAVARYQEMRTRYAEWAR
jgi:hypothetical protein